MTNRIHFAQRKMQAFRISKLYDHTTYHVPFDGPFNRPAILAALRARLSCDGSEAIGGTRSVGAVSLVSPGILSVEILFSPANETADSAREIYAMASTAPWK